jgi:uncharacterized protein (DUF1501 family)
VVRSRRRPAAANTPQAPAGGGFEALYDAAVGDVLHGTGKESFEAMRMLKSITARPYQPANGAQYPASAFGRSLQQIAQLVKADVGLEVAFAESGGWDTHAGQGAAQGQLSQRLREFGLGLAALYRDLGDQMADVVIMTMSEFGARRARTARAAPITDTHLLSSPWAAAYVAGVSPDNGRDWHLKSSSKVAIWPSPPTSAMSSAKLRNAISACAT